MIDETVTVYSPRFSVPGVIAELGIATVLIAYHPPGERSRRDWFYDLAGGVRPGQRMGDHDDDATRYSVSSAMRDEAA